MLALNTGSVCDVCSEDYSSRLLPHSIPCGHVFCQKCCKNIIEKTSPRLSPACPFCREPFQSDSIRLIRIDCPPNCWTTPKFKALAPGIPSHNNASYYDDRLFLKPSDRSREEIRYLEDKVAKVALKKCSVEEVSTLYNELTQCLMSDTKHDDQLSSLSLSAALLRAILTNHFAHSNAIRAAKNVELELQSRLDYAEKTIVKLEAGLRRQTTLHNQKVQESQSLAAEMDRLKLILTTLGMPPARDSCAFPISSSPTPLASTVTYSSPPLSLPRAYSTHSAAAASANHTRSISMSSTPAVPSCLHTQTQIPSIPRSHTPSIHNQLPVMRSQTAAASSTFRPENSNPLLPTLPAHLSTPFTVPTSGLPHMCAPALDPATSPGLAPSSVQGHGLAWAARLASPAPGSRHFFSSGPRPGITINNFRQS